MREFGFQQLFERSLIKNYKGPVYSKFLEAIETYQLISKGDKIAVALSGGKDSLIMAKLFQELKRHGTIDFELVFITMDPGFYEEDITNHISLCQRLGIDVIVEKSNIFDITETISADNPCYLCARMRRGFLYKIAQKYGCNKLALGHHFDDVIETTLLNILYAGCFKTMLPKAKSENYENLQLIRPMYLIKEKDLIRVMRYHKIDTMSCGCKVARNELESKRKEVKKLIENLRKTYKNIDINIFRAAENVNLESILGYFNDHNTYTFLDKFNK
jgi:tRNA(Ile)-lysidine synthase TilS/MesJ